VGAKTFEITMKHVGGMADMWTRVEIDDHERRVTVELDRLDSALVCDLVGRVLPRDHQVVAFRDATEGWVPERPPYSLRLLFDERYYQGEVARVEEDLFTLVVDSGADDRNRQAREAAGLVLAALHEIGVCAAVTGAVAAGVRLPRDAQLDVLVLGSALPDDADGLPGVDRRVKAASTLPYRLLFEQLLGAEATQQLLSGATLRWDPVRRRVTNRS
jgi:hypothetical protein